MAKQHISFRLDSEALEYLRWFSESWGISQALVLELLLREAAREGRELRAMKVKEELSMGNELFTSPRNLETLKLHLEKRELGGVNASQAVQMIRTIERLRIDNKRLGRIRDAAEALVYKGESVERLGVVVSRHGRLEGE
jgi:hypothetical protein